jgi:hypothetical protein
MFCGHATHQVVLHAVGLLTAHLAKVRGAKQIISIDCVDYRLDRVKQVGSIVRSSHVCSQPINIFVCCWPCLHESCMQHLTHTALQMA